MQARRPSGWSRRLRSRAVLGPALFASALAAQAPPAAEPKTHVLYVGADLSIRWRGDARAVVDVQGASPVVEANGKRVTIPADDRHTRILLESSLKLSRTSAHVSALHGEPTHSATANPYRGTEAAATMAQDAIAEADLAAGHLRNVEVAATWGLGGAVDPLFKDQLADAQQGLSQSLHAQNEMVNAPDSRTGSSASGNHDAFRLSFIVSAQRPLARPYAVVLAKYLEQPGNARTERLLVYAQALARVDERPRRYHLLRAGLPAGYELRAFELHLYDGAEEIPTTVSPRRVELTADEAFQYIVTQHGASETSTRPPEPARDFWPADLASRVSPENRGRPLFVVVDSSGRAMAAFHDRAGKQPAQDADIAAVLPSLRFLPALEKGKATTGVCRVILGE